MDKPPLVGAGQDEVLNTVHDGPFWSVETNEVLRLIQKKKSKKSEFF